MKNSKMSTETKFTAPHILSGMLANTPILLALSGGADSSALLFMLCEYCKKSGAPLAVAHVNHMIRGEDAERDRDFCRSLAKKLGLPFYLLEADVPALAREHKRGLEEEARITRYEFFEKVMRENSIPLLATAHNATDNAETVIFNLTRGSGLHGMCGIPPTREFSGGRIIRPLLKMSKDEILAFCRENGIPFYNFTYAREAFMPCLDKYYFDLHHFNKTGAEIFSDAFGRFLVMLKNGEDVEPLFKYSRYEYIESLGTKQDMWRALLTEQM